MNHSSSLGRIRIAVLTALLLSTVLALVVTPGADAVGTVPNEESPRTVANPALAAGCGLDLNLIVDRSAVAEPDKANLRRSAQLALNALAGTGSSVRIFTVGDRATTHPGADRAGTSDIGAAVFDDADLVRMPTFGAIGGSNWDDAFEMVRRAPAGVHVATGQPMTHEMGELTVVLTTSDPTVRNAEKPDGHGFEINDGGDATTTNLGELNHAILEANQIKRGGSHLFLIGLGSMALAMDDDRADSIARFQGISGPIELTDPNTQGIADTDFALLRDFDQVGALFRDLVADQCGPTVIVTKKVIPSNGTIDDAVVAPGFEFTAEITPEPIAWTMPADATGTAVTTTTNTQGMATFSFDAIEAGLTSVAITEIQQPNHVLDQVECERDSYDGKERELLQVAQDLNFEFEIGAGQVVFCTVYNRVTDPAHSITKTADTAGPISTPSDVGYEIVYSNDGDAPLSNVSITDPLLDSLTCVRVPGDAPFANDGTESVAFGEDIRCNGTYTVTQAVIDGHGVDTVGSIDGNGFIDNVVTGSADELQDDVVAAVHVPVAHEPASSVTKAADVDIAGQGDTVNYSITYRNDGNVTLTGVTINDPLVDTMTCSRSDDSAFVNDGTQSVAVGETVACEASFAVTNTVVDANGVDTNGEPDDDGDIDNIVTATADQDGPKTAEAVVVIEEEPDTPALDIDKTGSVIDIDRSGGVTAGDQIDYVITVSNVGNTDLTGVTIADPLLGQLRCERAGQTFDQRGDFLPIGAQVECVASLDVGPAMIAGPGVAPDGTIDSDGVINNTATATSNEAASVQDSHDEPIAALGLDKVVLGFDDRDLSDDLSVGDLVNYEITVTNTGQVELTDISVRDSLIPNLNCGVVPNPLDIGAAHVCTGSYQVDAADLDAPIVNLAGADSNETLPVIDQVTVTPGAPKLAFNKVLDGYDDRDASGDVSVGDVLRYTLTATNTGGSNLTNVLITDDLTGDSTACAGPIPTGESCVLETEYEVQASDLGSTIENTGVASSDQTPSEQDSVSEPVPTPDFEIIKMAEDPANGGFAERFAGESVDFSITVINTGTANLTNMVIDDPLTGDREVCVTPLVPGARCVLLTTYVLTQDDIDRGYAMNVATGTNDQTIPKSDMIEVPVPVAPSLSITKSQTIGDQTPLQAAAGDVVTYTIVGTNDGNATVSNVVIDDPMAGLSPMSCDWPGDEATLAPGESVRCTAVYRVTAADVGTQLLNVASIVGTAPDGAPVPPQQADVELPVPLPALSVPRSPDTATSSTRFSPPAASSSSARSDDEVLGVVQEALAFTGSNAQLLTGIGSGLILAGALLVSVGNRRKDDD